MSVDDYLEQAPEPQRSTLLVLRSTLRDLLPDATEELSYGMPAFVVGGKPVAGYAWAKRCCSYYPHSGAVLTELADLLDGYDWSRGTLRFPADEPLPPELVTRLVEVKLDHLAGTGCRVLPVTQMRTVAEPGQSFRGSARSGASRRT